jgi:hypothetical protein
VPIRIRAEEPHPAAVGLDEATTAAESRTERHRRHEEARGHRVEADEPRVGRKPYLPTPQDRYRREGSRRHVDLRDDGGSGVDLEEQQPQVAVGDVRSAPTRPPRSNVRATSFVEHRS